MQQTQSSSNSTPSRTRTWAGAVVAFGFACLLGLGAGALMARLAPEDKFSWAGLAIAPLWLLLEIYFEGVVGVLGTRSKTLRILTTIAVLAGFYGAWFALRS